MIISHKYKFIYTKPRKVAGTSIQVALAQHCGPDDIITPETEHNSAIDETQYTSTARNDDGYFNHMSARRVRQKVGKETWDDYYTFTIVRNPWDMLVSRYFWMMKGATPRKSPTEVLAEIAKQPLMPDLYTKLAFSVYREMRGLNLTPDDTFEDFLGKMHGNYLNTKYYFDTKGNPLNDFVIRFEELDRDYETVCGEIGIPYEPLPRLKTKTRKKRDYRDFYTPELRELVAKKLEREIEYFGYEFSV